MAVIVRTSQVIGGQPRENIPQYMSTRPVGPAQREQAQALDSDLHARMGMLEDELERRDLLNLKGRPGVVRLWWEVGRHLREFVPHLDVGPDEDRQYIWRALYDHAPKLVPGTIGSRAERLMNSHFRYCYLLGQFSWREVERFGDWTSWVEVFDSDRIREDPRIAEWLVSRVTSPDPEWARYTDRKRMAWFRPLAKAVRARFHNRDSTGLTQQELRDELDAVFESVRQTAA